ncbi:unnamed protein product [Euphydryas editha]|uniref:Uncharacterized protein n=1 Tax=Euphydryas editha TaxID=104508 RepID=A0AAU9V772_EUPED|nr:unnamed protein product [Euphydryas editha]
MYLLRIPVSNVIIRKSKSLLLNTCLLWNVEELVWVEWTDPITWQSELIYSRRRRGVALALTCKRVQSDARILRQCSVKKVNI